MNPHAPFLAEARVASPREAAEFSRSTIEGVRAQMVPVLILEDRPTLGDLPGYVAGDVVGLAPAVAESFVAAGVATYDIDAHPRREVRRSEMTGGILTAAAGGPVAMEMLRSYGNVVRGDVVGFNPDLAHELEVRGIARPKARAPLVTRTLRSIRDALTGRR